MNEWMGLEVSYDLDSLTTIYEVGLLVIAPPVVFLDNTYGVKHQMMIHWFVKCLTPSLDCAFSSPLNVLASPSSESRWGQYFLIECRAGDMDVDTGCRQKPRERMGLGELELPGSKLLVCNIFSPTFSITSSSPHATPSQSNQILSGPSLSFCSLICIMGILLCALAVSTEWGNSIQQMFI